MFDQIPPTPLYQRGARGDFTRLTAYVNSIGLNPDHSRRASSDAQAELPIANLQLPTAAGAHNALSRSIALRTSAIGHSRIVSVHRGCHAPRPAGVGTGFTPVRIRPGVNPGPTSYEAGESS